MCVNSFSVPCCNIQIYSIDATVSGHTARETELICRIPLCQQNHCWMLCLVMHGTQRKILQQSDSMLLPVLSVKDQIKYNPQGSQTLFLTCIQQMQCQCVQPKMMLNTFTSQWQYFFYEQSRTYLLKILALAPIAEFCASPTDNSSTFCILELGTLHGSQHFSLVPV